MSLQVIANRVSVYEFTGVDDDGQMTATEHVYARGEVLPDFVEGHQAFVLVQTGLAAEVGDQPDSRLRPVEAAAAPVMLPEHSPTAVVGSGVSGPMVVKDRVDETRARKMQATGGEQSGSQSSSGGELESLPEDNATKYAWEGYATRKLPSEHRMTQQEAESMKKSELVTEVKNRYQQAQSQQQDDAASDTGESGSELPRSY